jgi:hypothetical protein
MWKWYLNDTTFILHSYGYYEDFEIETSVNLDPGTEI